MVQVEASPRVVLDGGHFFEGPRWRDGRLWVSDFFGKRVVSADGAGTDVRVEAEVENRPSGLGWLPDGRLLVVSMLDQLILVRDAAGRLSVHADLSPLTGGYMINDMRVDAAGNAYVSTIGFDPYRGEPMRESNVLLVRPDGSTGVASSEGLIVPNGSLFLPDGTFVVAETMRQRLHAFRQATDGTLVDHRIWATFGDVPETTDVMERIGALAVGPDGICADSEGAIWVADSFHNRVLRVREGGEIVDEIVLAASGAYACALGGPDGQDLYVCSAPDFDDTARSAAAEASVLAFRVPVPA
ncbi:SMP-30/gluconolactonase/LRE family protein [Pseudonocardia pini]|uniref:SMP-30/gluconolactonase/LRE family protein n=1 Tax=Pseudonocardia pini TaxID=2758030 RepID=UPI0015F09ED4|nr:SMP-30/gluconolactonase/LRE family protein [Pseudonocardia pini]